MDDEQRGDEAVEMDPWQVFETRLRAYVSTMIDPSDEDRLVLHVPTARVDRGETEVVIGVCDGATGLRVDYAFDRSGDPAASVDSFAHRISQTIQFRYAPPHPGLITVRAEGPAAGGVGVLGLALHDDVPVDSVSRDEGSLSWPQDRDSLEATLVAHLADRFECEVEVDSDGDVCLVLDGGALWARVEPEAPMIRLFAMVVDGVESARQAGVELNIVNRDHRWSRWVRRRDEIWQELHVPAYPFVPRTFDALLDGFVADKRRCSDDLADRLDATVVR